MKEDMPTSKRPTLPPNTHTGSISEAMLQNMLQLVRFMQRHKNSSENDAVKTDYNTEVRLYPYALQNKDHVKLRETIMTYLCHLVRTELKAKEVAPIIRKEPTEGPNNYEPWVRVYKPRRRPIEQHADNPMPGFEKSTYSVVVCLKSEGEPLRIGTVTKHCQLTDTNSTPVNLNTGDFALFESKYQHAPSKHSKTRMVWAMEVIAKK